MAHVRQLWNEWEIQSMVLVSFSLQAFLLFFSAIRKRTTSRVLSMFLWLAYLSADSLAIFVIGHLALHVNVRHELMLFWAPFMLLHLGGQETITAFSMEDNMLWKRHLLSLATQVALTVYVVGNQWHGNKQLLSPMVLIFISGTVRYAERTWALMTAAKAATPSSSFLAIDTRKPLLLEYTFGLGMEMLMKKPQAQGHIYKDLVMVAGHCFDKCMAFLVGAPSMLHPELGFERFVQRAKMIGELRSKEDRDHIAYKLVDVQLSLMYDYLYTKFGMSHTSPVIGGILRLVTLGSTSTALTLFVRANQKGLLVNYNRADIVVSYILLIGAITLEVFSNLMVISSYSAYITFEDFLSAKEFFFTMIKRAHPESRSQWSEELGQYNIIGGCVQEKQAGLLERFMLWVGIKQDITHVGVSTELKGLLLDKLLQIGSSKRYASEWDFTKFRGQWVQWELETKCLGSESNLQALLADSTERVAFLKSVLVWHIATDICFSANRGCNSPCRGSSREISNYIIYLAKHGIMAGNDVYFDLTYACREVTKSLGFFQQEFMATYKHKDPKLLDNEQRKALEQQAAVRCIERGEDNPKYEAMPTAPVLPRARQLAKALLAEIKKENDRWELILNVWMEMLCYIAYHCGSHTTHLSSGGEFITHVRVLMLNLSLTVFLPGTN